MLVIQALEAADGVMEDLVDVEVPGLLSQGVEELGDIGDVRVGHQILLEAGEEGEGHPEEGQPAVQEEGVQEHDQGGVLEEAAEECHDPLPSDNLMA